MDNNNVLEIQQQRVDNAKIIIVSYLNISSISNKDALRCTNIGLEFE